MTNSTSESSSTPADSYGDLIRRARELEERATPGPWEWTVDEWVELSHREGENIALVMAFPRGSFGGHRPYEEDREFTAESRQLVPDLANALEAVVAENAQLKAWLATIARVFNPKPPEEREDEE